MQVWAPAKIPNQEEADFLSVCLGLAVITPVNYQWQLYRWLILMETHMVSTFIVYFFSVEYDTHKGWGFVGCCVIPP